MKLFLRIAFAQLFVCLTIGIFAQTCITNPIVTNNANSGPGSLRQAIMDACPGSTITFDMSTVVSPIITEGVPLTIDKNLTIQGPGADLLNIHNNITPEITFVGRCRVFEIDGSTVNISGLTISGGWVDHYLIVNGGSMNGAGINNSGVLTVSNCIVTGNTIVSSSTFGVFGYGAGIYNEGSLTVVNSVFTNNTEFDGSGDAAYFYGLAIANQGGSVLIDKSTFSEHNLPGSQYAVTIMNYDNSNMTITNSTISDNIFGVENRGNLKLMNSTLSGNGNADLLTSGALKSTSGTCAVTNCTITGNSTIGIIKNNGSALTIANSIISGNTTDYSGAEAPGSLGHNIIGIDDPTRWTGPSDQVGTAGYPKNALLGPLANNGGPTYTHALLAGSPAINTGDNALALDAGGSPLTTDQRGSGFPRINYNTVDAGAYEAANTTIPVVAIADHYTTNLNTTISRTSSDTDDLLDNDYFGSSPATLTSFGGGSLGGSVTDNAAGATIALAGGNLKVNSDGSFSLTTPNEYGSFTFRYRLTDASGISDAVVTINVITDSTRWYVNAAATPGGSGISWNRAFQSLQDALLVAGPGHEIWVAAGVYKPTSSTDKSISFIMKNEVAIYGGFNGTETTLSQRNWSTNVTTLSGDIGTPNDNGDNSYHVIANIENNIDYSAVLDGFTITGGNAGAVYYGGGMRNIATTPTINNCIFVGNTAGEGGAVINESCNPKFTNCIFKGNIASYGGAISNAYGSSPILMNCTFFGNSSLYGEGGIIYNDGSIAVGVSSPILTNCIVWGNSGGIFNAGGSANINFSIVQGGCPAGSVCSNVSNVDPLFVSNSNLHLQTGSPAINAGTNTGAPSTDIEGNPRALTVPDPADIGAYETSSCAAPVITGVTNINSSRATVHWNPVATAISYITRKYPTGTTNYSYGGYKKPITDTLKTVRNMSPSTAYSVQVKSICAGGTDSSDWSAPFDFVTKPDCHPPTSLDVTNVTTTGATLNWTLPLSMPLNFQVRYRPVGALKWKRFKLPSSDVTTVLQNLVANTEYEWRMISLCTDDTSKVAIGPHFTTASAFASAGTPTINNSKLIDNVNVRVMPNPNKGSFSIQMQLPKLNAETTIQLFNSFDVKIWQEDLGNASGSINKNVYLENKLPSGVYMLRVQRNDVRYTTKIVISK